MAVWTLVALRILEVDLDAHAFYTHMLEVGILDSQAIEKLLGRLRTILRERLAWSSRRYRRRISSGAGSSPGAVSSRTISQSVATGG
jgi:hypothetical protein